MSFNSFGLHPSLLRGVQDLGFAEPTPIQRDSIPHALKGHDLLACSMTGSGKTAAFLLPILHQIMGKQRGATRALVITPTRELAAQIEEHLRTLARHTPVTSAAIFGGVAMGPQERAFRSGYDVLIATPGRLLDHLTRPYANLGWLEHLVIDEADRMLDMGFLPDIRRILKQVPAKRQTLFFSATLPPPIVTLTKEMLHKPVALNIERQSSPATGITHAVYSVPQTMKSSLLLHLLNRDTMESVVVFTRTKQRANRLAAYLAQHGISCARIHGNRSQSQRTLALAGFKNREFRVLVATDIAARGIDVESLSHVVNFDVPNVPEDYIHRVGRTARAEATGDAVTFVSSEEEADLRGIEKVMGKKIPRCAVPQFEEPKASEPRYEAPRSEPVARRRPAKTPPQTPRVHAGPTRSRSASDLQPKQEPVSNRRPFIRQERTAKQDPSANVAVLPQRKREDDEATDRAGFGGGRDVRPGRRFRRPAG
jgi:ATP-dependent RNA helicase RhlE